MFGIRRNNKNDLNTPILMTLVGLGVGAATYGLIRGRNDNQNNNNMMEPIQKAMNEIRD